MFLRKKLILASSCWTLLGSMAWANFHNATEFSKDDISVIRSSVFEPALPLREDRIILPVRPAASVARQGPFREPESIEGQDIQRFLTGGDRDHLNSLRRLSVESLKETEFIFTGRKDGGQRAAVLALLWSQQYAELTGEKPQKNQLKVVTFSSPVFGDKELHESLISTLGRPNFLNFSSYFSKPIPYGISIHFMPSEELRSFSPSALDIGLPLMMSVVSASVWGDLQNMKTALSSVKNPSGRFSKEPYLELKAPLKVAADESLINFFNTAIASSSSKLGITAIVSAALFFYRLYLGYRFYQFMPSNDLVWEAYRFTQDNYRANPNESLNTVGIPPLFSFRRGIGKIAGWFFSVS